MLVLPAPIDTLAERLLPIDSISRDAADELHDAAVLVLLFPHENEIRFLLTVRPETLRRHAGQVSLPGGRAEAQDRSLWETALRETHEELGVETTALLPLGRLDPVTVAISGHRVWPFVAWSHSAPELQPNAGEVAQVIEVPVNMLLDPDSIDEEEWDLLGTRRLVTFYRVDDLIVWGATARILSDLADRIRGEGAADKVPGSVEEKL